MKKIVIYGSKYGTTYKYASEFSRHTGMELLKFEEVRDINQYDLIVYFGALYAGGVLGLAKTLKGITDLENKQILIATVGLADPLEIKNVEKIRSGIKNQISSAVYDVSQIYHLRGGINYSKLNFIHKNLMGLLYRKAKKLPKEKRDADAEAMIDTYNQVVDFVDIGALQKIYEVVNGNVS